MKRILIALIIIFTTSCHTNTKKDTKQESIGIKEKIKQDSITKAIEKNKERFNSVIISNVSYEIIPERSRAAIVRGVSGFIIHFDIKNDSDIGVKRILLEGTFKYDGRNYQYSDEINYEFRKGLEPGEVEKISATPGILTEWNNKIKRGDKGDFSLKLLKIEDYQGNIIKQSTNL